MIDRDRTGLAAATIALGLASGAWMAEGWLSAEAGNEAVLDPASVTALESHNPGQPLTVARQDGTETITPASAFKARPGVWCRGYVVKAAISGQAPSGGIRHVACRNADGQWTRMPSAGLQVAAN